MLPMLNYQLFLPLPARQQRCLHPLCLSLVPFHRPTTLLHLSSHLLLNSTHVSSWLLLLLHLIIPALILLVSATGSVGSHIIIVVVPSLLLLLGVLTSVVSAQHSNTFLTVEVPLTAKLLGWVAIWVLVVISSAWSVHSN